MLLTVNNLARGGNSGGARRFPTGDIAQPAASTRAANGQSEFSDDLLEPNTGSGAI
ncbi:MAG: hypothetical protein ABSA14_14295 [Acidimicrobiales bacterium]